MTREKNPITRDPTRPVEIFEISDPTRPDPWKFHNLLTRPDPARSKNWSTRPDPWPDRPAASLILRFWVFLDFSLLFSTFLLLLRICWREFYSGNDPHLNQVSSRQHLVVLFSLLKVLAYGCDILECYLVACYIFKLLCASTFKKKW